MMQKNNLVVFDIDGTLTDSVKQHQKAFSEMLFEIGVKKISSEFKSFKHHTDSFIAKEIYEADQKKTFSKEKKSQFEIGLTDKIKSQSFNEITGAKRLIRKLQYDTDFGICFATGSLKRAAEHKLKSIGIEFEAWQLVASDEIHEREGIVSQAIENATNNYKVQKFERIVSVGDGLWDLLTAQNLNLEFIGVGASNENKLIEKGAKLVYRDLSRFDLKTSSNTM